MRVAVIGAGSWGTAIAWMLGTKGEEVRLWAHRLEVAETINTNHRNPRYLVDVVLPQTITASVTVSEVLDGAEAVVVVTPSATMRDTARMIVEDIALETPVIVLSKGVEAGTGYLMLDVLAQELGSPRRFAVLSGPTHAEEVAIGMPSAAVVASSAPETARFFQDLFFTPEFRVYTSEDVVGVELCAACKNIIAIGCGVAAGAGYGDNTAAMIMTRGLAEMSRLTKALGGDPLTCMGLAGMGDLIVTCTSAHSRNRSLGMLLAKGGTLEEFTEKTHMVAEGAIAARTVTDLARSKGIELPLSEVMRSMLWEGMGIQEAASQLLTRSPKEELHGMDDAL